MLQLPEIGEALHDKKADIAETHRFEVEIAHYKRREVESGHIVKQLVCADRVAREGEDQILRSLRVALEIGRLAVCAERHGIVRESHGPDHAPRIRQPRTRRASGTQALHDASGHVGHVGVGITLKKSRELLPELFGVVFGQIRERVDEDELREYLRQRKIALHIGRQTVNYGVVVFQICVIGAGIHLLLHLVHAPQIVEIGGIAHSLAIRGIGKIRKNELPPPLGLGGLAPTHGH